jgi:hypothetical protein
VQEFVVENLQKKMASLLRYVERDQVAHD